ncbi:MAG: hypothetical protein RLZZ397_339 [Pseudomonadota bacterium]
MSLLPYSLARSVLFRMDPESAHETTLRWLERTQHNLGSLAWKTAPVIDPVQVAGLTWRNRVGLAAGLDKNARCVDAWDHMGFGFAEVGTVTPLAQPGNPKPRIFRLPRAQALINRLGFNNDGLEAFVSNVQQSRFRKRATQNPLMNLGLNIGKNAITPIEEATSDYLKGLEGVWPYADYVTVNISSPNTKNLRQLQTDDALDQLLNALEKKRQHLMQEHASQHKPIFIKIAPDLTDEQIESIAQLMRRYGYDSTGQPHQGWGLIATNTTLERSGVQGLEHANETGGLSGQPVRELSNRVIRALRQLLGPSFPIIGVGGVMSAADALEKRQAGADLVQIYTGLIYRGTSLVQECAQAMQSSSTLLEPTSK